MDLLARFCVTWLVCHSPGVAHSAYLGTQSARGFCDGLVGTIAAICVVDISENVWFSRMDNCAVSDSGVAESAVAMGVVQRFAMSEMQTFECTRIYS